MKKVQSDDVDGVPELPDKPGRPRFGYSHLIGMVVVGIFVTAGLVMYRGWQDLELTKQYRERLDLLHIDAASLDSIRENLMQARICHQELSGSWQRDFLWGVLIGEILNLGPDAMEVGKIRLDMDYAYLPMQTMRDNTRGAPSREFDLMVAAWVPSESADQVIAGYLDRLRASPVISPHLERLQIQGVQRRPAREGDDSESTLFALEMSFRSIPLLR
jgi:hypothetical protein